jgi:protocatechuate 3,4-dioxygenase beta subunit
MAAAAAAAAVPAFGGGLNCGLPGGDAPSRLEIARPGAGEQALVVGGRVFQPDGKTPASGVVLYVYHTDASGVYARERGAPPRLRGWLRTDAEGRYEYRTIRPAPYPGGSEAAHVHTQLWGDDVPPQWGTTLLFADDPLVRPAERRRSADLGRFAFVCAPAKGPGGAQRCSHDLRLRREGDEFEAVTRHGLVPTRQARDRRGG